MSVGRNDFLGEEDFMKKNLAMSILILILIMNFAFGSNPVSAETVIPGNIDSVGYHFSSDLSAITNLEINSINFLINFALTSINKVETSVNYDGSNFGLQGVWLVNFTQEYTHDLNLRLGLTTREGIDTVEPLLGLGGRSDLWNRLFVFGNLDYYFNKSDKNLFYRLGLGIPLTYNSDFLIAGERSFWHANGFEVSMGLEIDF